MLILTRRNNEDIVIRAGEHVIELKVCRLLPHKVKLGFNATPGIEINRREIDIERHGQPGPGATAASES